MYRGALSRGIYGMDVSVKSLDPNLKCHRSNFVNSITFLNVQPGAVRLIKLFRSSVPLAILINVADTFYILTTGLINAAEIFLLARARKIGFAKVLSDKRTMSSSRGFAAHHGV